jgi:hypothetical protein
MVRRITRDLIRELCAEAAPTDLAALVVAIGGHTALVYSADPDPLDELNHLLREGGRPVGILRQSTVGGESRFSIRPIQECAGEPWVRSYLQAVTEAVSAGDTWDCAGG